ADRARARPGDGRRRRRLGAGPAVAADAAAPARPGLLVALLGAAAVRRARRPALPLAARARDRGRRAPRGARAVIVARIMPQAEMVHWWFATGFLILGLLLVSEAVVGEEVWGMRPWRRYLWPSFAFLMGVLMFPVMTFFTNSTIHMLAHGSWAQVLLLAGGAELGVARGKLHSPHWRLCSALGLAVSGAAF